VAVQTRLEQESGVKGYSLFFAPSREARAAYPHLQHLWDRGLTAAPYDTMHLVLQGYCVADRPGARGSTTESATGPGQDSKEH